MKFGLIYILRAREAGLNANNVKITFWGENDDQIHAQGTYDADRNFFIIDEENTKLTWSTVTKIEINN